MMGRVAVEPMAVSRVIVMGLILTAATAFAACIESPPAAPAAFGAQPPMTELFRLDQRDGAPSGTLAIATGQAGSDRWVIFDDPWAMTIEAFLWRGTSWVHESIPAPDLQDGLTATYQDGRLLFAFRGEGAIWLGAFDGSDWSMEPAFVADGAVPTSLPQLISSLNETILAHTAGTHELVLHRLNRDLPPAVEDTARIEPIMIGAKPFDASLTDDVLRLLYQPEPGEIALLSGTWGELTTTSVDRAAGASAADLFHRVHISPRAQDAQYVAFAQHLPLVGLPVEGAAYLRVASPPEWNWQRIDLKDIPEQSWWEQDRLHIRVGDEILIDRGGTFEVEKSFACRIIVSTSAGAAGGLVSLRPTSTGFVIQFAPDWTQTSPELVC